MMTTAVKPLRQIPDVGRLRHLRMNPAGRLKKQHQNPVHDVRAVKSRIPRKTFLPMLPDFRKACLAAELRENLQMQKTDY